MIKIITDSTTDIAPELLEQLSGAALPLAVLPLTITIGDKNYLDGIDITVEEIYAAMRAGIVPKTSQIPYENTLNLFTDCCREGHDLIYISFSSQMSGCYDMGQLAAREVGALYPLRRLAVVDSRCASCATGLIVLQALKMAASGMDFDDLLQELDFMCGHGQHFFSACSLEWLAKGGRIPHLVGRIGSQLNLRPLIVVKDGRLTAKKLTRGTAKSLQTITREIVEHTADFPEQLIAINHADDYLCAVTLAQMIKQALPECTTAICAIGGVVSAHVGLGGVGAYCLSARPRSRRD